MGEEFWFSFSQLFSDPCFALFFVGFAFYWVGFISGYAVNLFAHFLESVTEFIFDRKCRSLKRKIDMLKDKLSQEESK